MIGNGSPLGLAAAKETEMVPPLEIGEPALELVKRGPPGSAIVDITAPLSSFHYQVKKVGCFCLLSPAKCADGL